MNVRTIATEIEKQSRRPLRIQGLLRKRKETLEQFLVKFFNTWNEDKPTIYADTQEVQTEPGKRRSIGDIYMICKYYYPKCTLKQVSDILYGALFGKVKSFRSSHCSMIKKRVFYKGEEDESSEIFGKDKADEWGRKVEDWHKKKIKVDETDDDDDWDEDDYDEDEDDL